MKKSINMKPYSELWIDCYTNSYLSLLTSYDKSYRIAPLINDYHYLMAGSFGWVSLLDLKYSDRFYKDIHLLNVTKYKFVNEQNYMKELKDCIDDGKNISIKVDLYNWIPNSLTWEKEHYHHMSSVIGYDDEKSVFYIFDDDAYGYHEHEIPYGRFDLSVIKENGIEARQTNFPELIKPFYYQFTDLFLFAERIKNDISYLSYVEHFYDFTKGTLLHFITTATKIGNRQIANRLLFLHLHEEGYITSELCNILTEYAETLQSGWETIKYLIMKCLHNNKRPDYERINKLSWDNLLLEYKMWDCFIKQ